MDGGRRSQETGMDDSRERGLFHNQGIARTVGFLHAFDPAVPLTMWIDASDAGIEVVIDALHRLFTNEGFPLVLQADKAFDNSIMVTFCAQHNISPAFSAPYHHRGNGLAERTIQLVDSTIAKVAAACANANAACGGSQRTPLSFRLDEWKWSVVKETSWPQLQECPA